MQDRIAVFLVLVVSLSAIFSSITYFAIAQPPNQQFIGLGVYSTNGLAGYVPASNATVSPGQSLNWTLSITNRMGSAQFIMIIVRLENSTLQSPTSTTPSIIPPEVVTPERFIGDGDVSNITFTWMLNSLNQTGRLVFPNLTVNGQSYPSSRSIGAASGESFRWVFELWTYDVACGNQLSSGCFHYGYGPQNSPTGSWLQVWFNT